MCAKIIHHPGIPKEWVSRVAFHKIVVDITIYWMRMTMFKVPGTIIVFFNSQFFVLLFHLKKKSPENSCKWARIRMTLICYITVNRSLLFVFFFKNRARKLVWGIKYPLPHLKSVSYKLCWN